MLWIEIAFNGLCIVVTTALVIMIVFLIMQIVSWQTKMGANRKVVIVTIVCIVAGILLINWIYNYFGIYLFTNISIYNNIFFQVLQIITSIYTIGIVIFIVFQIVMYVADLNRKKIRVTLIYTGISFMIIVSLVFWLYETTGLMLFTDLSPYIYY
ncbi:MAG: hypothetical protein ACTSPY_02595 [Candidatus Helarchaeota archaeon]